MMAVTVLACGCAVSHKTAVKPSDAPAPLLTASKEELIAKYNGVAEAITSLNATVTMKLTAGSAYTGLIEQYHEINGFILAAKPANIRVIGQAPIVSKNIFDMVSDGETFHIYLPSKNKFLEGPANFERQTAKPIENLRPQHLVDALLWATIPEGSPVLYEEASEAPNRYYILTLVRAADHASATEPATTGSSEWEIARKIWFDRTNLRVSRIENFAGTGKVASDVRYSDWQPTGASQGTTLAASKENKVTETIYPRQITLTRQEDNYELQIGVKKLAVNEQITADRFLLKQPPGTEIVKVGDDAKEPQQP